MNRTQKCRGFARAGVLFAALALAPSAFAHAHLYPDEMPSGHGSLLQLAVPNEEENASTTQIVMTVPSGFELGSVATVPGWTAAVSGNTVTWKGKLDGESSRSCRSPVRPRKRATTRSRSARPTRTAASSTGRATRTPTPRPR